MTENDETREMFAAAYDEDFETVQKWITKEADPLATLGDQNLLRVMYNRLEVSSNKDHVLKMIQFIVNLPEYQEMSVKSEAVYHNVLLIMVKELFYTHHVVTAPMLNILLNFKQINNLVFMANLPDFNWGSEKSVQVTMNTLSLNLSELLVVMFAYHFCTAKLKNCWTFCWSLDLASKKLLAV
jgi:hypothetical protein